MKTARSKTQAAAPVTSAAVKEVPIMSPAPQKGDKLVRYGSASGQPGVAVTFANRWRENYNPFRNFAIRKAVEWLESAQRGDYAMYQWTCRKLERSYPTLSALISRCEAPLLNYKWDIKIESQLPDGWTGDQAKAQQKTLRTAYEAIDNLKEAIKHLHMAEFREYSHIQKHRTADGDIYHLECLDQWLVCRDGLYGDWFWNPDSKFTTTPATALGEANRIGGDVLPLDDFIIRQVARPINEVAIISFTRWALCNKNWDGFIEIYGLPSGVIEMPQNVPPDKEKEYEAAAREIAQGGSGAIPNGSKYTPNSSPRGTDPFTPRVKQLDEDLVLAGTGGKMGMLSGSAGLGGGHQSKTHDDVFQEIAAGRAEAIAETFQRSLDAEILGREHPGEPALVYFDLSPAEDVDLNALVTNVTALANVGFLADEAWLCEQTGYELTYQPLETEDIQVDQDDPGADNPEPEDRDPDDPENGDHPDEPDPADSTAVRNRLLRIAMASGDEIDREVRLLNRDFPGLGRLLNGGPGSGRHPGPDHARRSAGRRHLTAREKRFIRNAHAESRKVLRQRGRYEGKMEVPGDGTVRLTYGNTGSTGGIDGIGLSKIADKHGDDAIKQIPAVLVRGQRGPWEPDQKDPDIEKRQYVHMGNRVVLSRLASGRGGGPLVLTSFDPSAKILKGGK